MLALRSYGTAESSRRWCASTGRLARRRIIHTKRGCSTVRTASEVSHADVGQKKEQQTPASETSIADSFHLPTALDFAAVSWQAYQNPDDANEYVNTFVDGTITHYHSKAFATKAFAGVLKVKVLKVSTFAVPELDPKPEVRVSIGSSTALPTAKVEKKEVGDEEGSKPRTFQIPQADREDVGLVWLQKQDVVDGNRAALTIEIVDGKGRNATIQARGVVVLPEVLPASPDADTLSVTLQPLQQRGWPNSGARVYEVDVAVSLIRLQDPTVASVDGMSAQALDEGVALFNSISPNVLRFTTDTTPDPFNTDKLDAPEDPPKTPIEALESIADDTIDFANATLDWVSGDHKDPIPGLGIDGIEGKPEQLKMMSWQTSCQVNSLLVEATDKLAETFPSGFLLGSEAIAFIDNPATDTQAIIFWNPRIKQVAVSFRGTETTQWKDVLTDLRFRPAIFNGLDPDEDVDEPDGMFSKLMGGVFGSDESAPAVHSGFLAAWRSVQQAVEEVVRLASNGDTAWKITFTGHSLGGALASVAAASAVSKGLLPEGQIACITYGSPRVGNAAFTEAFNEKIPDSWRVCNGRDSVPTMPPERLSGFNHVSDGVYFKLGRYKDQSVKLAFANGNRPITAVKRQQIPTAAYENIVVPYNTIDGWLEGLGVRFRLFTALVTGIGVEQHMINEYMQSLIHITRAATEGDERAEEGLALFEQALETWREEARKAKEAEAAAEAESAKQ